MEWKKLECKRCGYSWYPKNPSRLPTVCAKCRSPYWDKPRANKTKKAAETRWNKNNKNNNIDATSINEQCLNKNEQNEYHAKNNSSNAPAPKSVNDYILNNF